MLTTKTQKYIFYGIFRYKSFHLCTKILKSNLIYLPNLNLAKTKNPLLNKLITNLKKC